jgi:RP/EB family microtubule-associated protein
MQDNLDFLQFSKRYWDQYYPGGDYDGVGRRKGGGPAASSGAGAPRGSATNAARRPTAGGVAPRTRTPQGGGAASAALQHENGVLKETVGGLERERDFYFSKLRDIELLIQQAVDADPELDKDDNGILKQIQAILYSTEVSTSLGFISSLTNSTKQEGFEIPAETEGDLPEEETF